MLGVCMYVSIYVYTIHLVLGRSTAQQPSIHKIAQSSLYS